MWAEAAHRHDRHCTIKDAGSIPTQAHSLSAQTGRGRDIDWPFGDIESCVETEKARPLRAAVDGERVIGVVVEVGHRDGSWVGVHLSELDPDIVTIMNFPAHNSTSGADSL